MATVIVPSIKTGDEITSTTINTFVDSVNALSNSVSADNLDIEAVDRRNLRVNIPRVAVDQHNRTLVNSGLNNKLSTLTVDHVVGEMIHVSASFHFYERTSGTYDASSLSTTYNSSSSSRSNFRFQISRRPVGNPSISILPSTERRFSSALVSLTGAYFPISRAITIDFYDTIQSSISGEFEYFLMGESFTESTNGTAFTPQFRIDGLCFFVVRYPR